MAKVYNKIYLEYFIRIAIKVDTGISTWRIWGFYIQCINAFSPRVRALATIAPSQQLHPHPRHEPLPAT